MISDFARLTIQIRDKLNYNRRVYSTFTNENLVNALFNSEISLVKLMSKYRSGNAGFKKFLSMVASGEISFIVAKSYFRDPQEVYNLQIKPVLIEQDHKKLMKFHANYNLLKIVMDNWESPIPSTIQKLWDKILLYRKLLVENNLPLAINRAKIFFKKVHPDDREINDLVSMCCQGILFGIDKFHGHYTPVWPSVCIGGMVKFLLKDINA